MASKRGLRFLQEWPPYWQAYAELVYASLFLQVAVGMIPIKL